MNILKEKCGYNLEVREMEERDILKLDVVLDISKELEAESAGNVKLFIDYGINDEYTVLFGLFNHSVKRFVDKKLFMIYRVEDKYIVEYKNYRSELVDREGMEEEVCKYFKENKVKELIEDVVVKIKSSLVVEEDGKDGEIEEDGN